MSNQLSTSIKPIPANWIDALFTKMFAMYGNKFSDMWRGFDIDSIKTTWAAELGRLSRDELAHGVSQLVNQEWPPTLPQFMKICRKNIDPLAAYYEAINGVVARERGEIGEWSHPAIFWASVKVGAFDLKGQSYQQIKSRWETALQAQIDAGTWKDIPEALIALPAPPTQATAAIADKFMEEIDVIKTAESKTDHKIWAKLIMQRHKAGDKSLSHIQISFAKEALAA